MAGPDDRSLDDDAGPVVRPYALVRGRTRSAGATLDVVAMATATPGETPGAWELDLEPEHFALLRRCRVPGVPPGTAQAMATTSSAAPAGLVRPLTSA